MKILDRWALLIARFLIAAIFVFSAVGKFMDPTGIAAFMTQFGIPAASVLVWIAAIVEIVAAILIIVGWQARIGAAALLVYLIVVTLIFHTGWSDPNQIIQFLKNTSIIGGLLAIIAVGPGKLAFDKD